jgi:hypothetical protein
MPACNIPPTGNKASVKFFVKFGGDNSKKQSI